MTTTKYEARFEGKDNAGLRRTLRAAAKGAIDDGRSVAEALRGTASAIALTASGKATLEHVILDYLSLVD